MFDFGEGWLLQRITLLVPLWLSLSVHEWAHAWCAFQLGDDTAARQGRMTLNPLDHVDPIGTLALPLLGVPFGWARPVPIEPLRFRSDVRMQTGLALAAAAGPISNLILAAIAALLLCGLAWAAPTLAGTDAALGSLLYMLVLINVLLALFNALPIPPLDGSRVLDAVVPSGLRPLWSQLQSLGPAPLIAILVAPALVGVSLFAWPVAALQQGLAGLLALVAS